METNIESLHIEESEVFIEYATDNDPLFTQDSLAGFEGEPSDPAIVETESSVSTNIPDAIQIETEKPSDEQVVNLEGVTDLNDQPKQGEGDHLDPAQSQIPTETIKEIYTLLQERLPEVSNEEETEKQSEDVPVLVDSISESESETSSIDDLYEKLDDVYSIESEQLSQLQQISDNIIILNNNAYHFHIYEIAIGCAIFGSLAIGFFFRKIG